MKIIIAGFLCLFFAWGACAQNEPDSKTVSVEEIILYKDDGDGNRGVETEEFLTTDKPIHCQILLDSEKSATVKMEMVAVEVKGTKAGAKSVVISYKTDGSQNIVNFKFNPQTVWNAGRYAINVLIDGKLSRTKEFAIKTADAKTQ